MHWELLVPVVVLAVWILSHLFRGAEEMKELPRAQPGQPAPPEPPRSEVDKFLDEIKRMRREVSEPRPAPPANLKDIPEVIPVEQPRPRPVPPPQQPQNRPPAPRPANVRQANPNTLPPPRPPQKQTKLRRPEAPKPTLAPPPSADVPHAAPAVVFFQHTPSPAITQTLVLIRNPTTLPAAFILQEVLGPPRSKRR